MTTDLTVNAADALGDPIEGARVRIELVTGAMGATLVDDDTVITHRHDDVTDETGEVTFSLTANEDIDPADTFYRVSCGSITRNIDLPADGGPYDWGDVAIIVYPDEVPGYVVNTGSGDRTYTDAQDDLHEAAANAYTDSELTTHAGASDHPDLSDANPAALGTAAPGVSTDAARADHVHEAPAGGGGETIFRNTSDVALTSNTVYVATPNMDIDVVDGDWFAVEWNILLEGSVSADCRVQLDAPAGDYALEVWAVGNSSSSTPANVQGQGLLTADGDQIISIGSFGGSSSDRLIRFKVHGHIAPTAVGTVGLSFALRSAVGTSYIKANSFVRYSPES